MGAEGVGWGRTRGPGESWHGLPVERLFGVLHRCWKSLTHGTPEGWDLKSSQYIALNGNVSLRWGSNLWALLSLPFLLQKSTLNFIALFTGKRAWLRQQWEQWDGKASGLPQTKARLRCTHVRAELDWSSVESWGLSPFCSSPSWCDPIKCFHPSCQWESRVPTPLMRAGAPKNSSRLQSHDFKEVCGNVSLILIKKSSFLNFFH